MAKKSFYDLGFEVGYAGRDASPPAEASIRGRNQFNKGVYEGERLKRVEIARARGED